MLISCKCLNFIATSNNPQQQLSAAFVAAVPPAVATADVKENNAAVAAVAMQQVNQQHLDSNISTTSSSSLSSNTNNNGSVAATGANSSLVDALRQAFLLRYPRNFVFYSQCIDFFKQAIGPVSDLNINVLNQKDLIYSLTLEVSIENQPSQSWQLSVCSNCNIALIAKRLSVGPNSPQMPQSFLINCGILTNNEELSQKRADKSFSETFGLLIMDHPKLESSANIQNQTSIGSLSASFATSAFNHLDSKQSRLRQLQSNLQQRLQREIAETDERIQRYTEQQFALLKSFREKSEQEYQMLVTLIQCIPEQQANEWLDRQPPSFDVSNNGGNLPYGASRRRNTISSRRDLNSTAPTTPTTIIPPSNIFGYSNKEIVYKNSTNTAITPTSPTSAIISTNNTRSATAGITAVTSPSVAAMTTASSTAPTIVSSGGGGSALNRKMSNFDTPPATPEATPMSVGNSPTFRQQQQQNISFVGHQTFQQQFPTPTIETADDCLFELEGVDAVSSSGINVSTTFINSSSLFGQNPPSPIRLQQQNQNLPHHILPGYNSYQRTLTFCNQPPDNHMSDLDESDGAEEAEDALDLDISTTSVPMMATPQRRININTAANMANFAKSLPIEIANSPLTSGRSYLPAESEEDELDNNVDIAASIKALAKSVHGEAVFGDLPRPRLRSQI